jgi:hypothetical protein
MKFGCYPALSAVIAEIQMNSALTRTIRNPPETTALGASADTGAAGKTDSLLVNKDKKVLNRKQGVK